MPEEITINHYVCIRLDDGSRGSAATQRKSTYWRPVNRKDGLRRPWFELHDQRLSSEFELRAPPEKNLPAADVCFTAEEWKKLKVEVIPPVKADGQPADRTGTKLTQPREIKVRSIELRETSFIKDKFDRCWVPAAAFPAAMHSFPGSLSSLRVFRLFGNKICTSVDSVMGMTVAALIERLPPSVKELDLRDNELDPKESLLLPEDLRLIVDQRHEQIIKMGVTENWMDNVHRDESGKITHRTPLSAKREHFPLGSTKREPRSVSMSERGWREWSVRTHRDPVVSGGGADRGGGGRDDGGRGGAGGSAGTPISKERTGSRASRGSSTSGRPRQRQHLQTVHEADNEPEEGMGGFSTALNPQRNLQGAFDAEMKVNTDRIDA